MKRRGLLGLMAIAVSFGVPAMAEQIVYFTNGTSLPIRTHRVEDGMIYLDMGQDNIVGFPFELVERIDQAGRDVLVRPSSSANKIFGDEVPTADTSYPAGGREMTHTKAGWRGDGIRQAGESPSPVVETDEKGMATYRPMGWSNGAQRRIRLTGHAAVTGGPVATTREEGIIGTSKLGQRHVIGGVNNPFYRGAPQLVGLAPRAATGAAPPPPAEAPPASQSDGGQP